MNESESSFPLTTSIARHYFWRQIITAVICAGLAVWGLYDLVIKIPHQTWTNEIHDLHESLLAQAESGELGPASVSAEALQLIPEEYNASEATTGRELLTILNDVTTRYERKPRPQAYDPYVQWMFISCILFVPYAVWRIRSINRHWAALDEEGNLTLPDGSVWPRDEIASIDMGRWMEKSIAWVVHEDGRRVKLDAYFHRNMEYIIGGIAHRFEPEKWRTDGKPVKAAIEETDQAPREEDVAANEFASVAAENSAGSPSGEGT